MKQINHFILALAGVGFATMPLRAEEAAQGTTPEPKKCACCMKEDADKMKAAMEKKMDGKMKKMDAKMKSATAELEKLVDEMNASTGEKKIEAMAAALNKILQAHKEMHAELPPEKKPAAEAKEPADPAAAHQH